MTRPTSSAFLALVCVFGAGGCAAMATKPPTPAAGIRPRDAAAMSAPPGVRFFLLVFGSESVPKRPKYSHTWATLAKVTSGGTDSPRVEEQTISWMPATLDIRPLSLRVEAGVNLGLHKTIREMLCQKERVTLWGPFEVGPGLAYRFEVQKAFLESGRVGYQCIDNIGEAARTGAGCDCIHAITDMDPLFDRRKYPLLFYGDHASRNIVRQVHSRPIVICPEVDHAWLLSMLGLDQYTIERRQYSGCTLPNTPENSERYLQHHDSK